MSRTADLPVQALNVDLCFVPFSHPVNIKLPAVSGSSGHLVVERLKEVGQEPDYPGKVFADPDLDYAEAVQAFVQASRPLFGPRGDASAVEKTSQETEIQQVRQEEIQLRSSRRILRKRRELEDEAWKATWQQQRAKKHLQKNSRNTNCVPIGVPAKRKNNIGKFYGNSIVNNHGSVNRKTNSGAWIE